MNTSPLAPPSDGLGSQTTVDVVVDLKVLIVDDHALFSEAVSWILQAEGMSVVQSDGTGAGGIEAALAEAPDLALVDMNLPDMDGIRVGEFISQACPHAKVVALTASRDSEMVRQALQAGFHGYLTKDVPLNELIQAIRATLAGQAVIPQHLASRVVGTRSAEQEHDDLLIRQLTSREREVLQLLAEGASGDDIGERFGISRNTVRSHVQNILTKLHVHSRLQAAAFATSHGLVPLAD